VQHFSIWQKLSLVMAGKCVILTKSCDLCVTVTLHLLFELKNNSLFHFEIVTFSCDIVCHLPFSTFLIGIASSPAVQDMLHLCFMALLLNCSTHFTIVQGQQYLIVP
jgi:hypothetical protein